MDTPVSIITATVGRLDQIDRLLNSLSQLNGYDEIKPEIIIANNAPDENQAKLVEALVVKFARRLKYPCRHVREPIPGKCRAQNRAIPLASGALLVFLDDDVEVTPDWLRAIVTFFQEFPHDVMQGSVFMRDQDRNDPQILKDLNRYRTIDYIDYGAPPGSELFTLTGGNMAIRKSVFDKVGLFNEKLGPGQAGISEDVEFAKRVVAAGLKIGYEPRAAVYNEMDRSRLSEREFRRRHEAQGRSRLAYKRQSLVRIVANLWRSIVTFAWFFLIGNERRKYRAKGRYFHYRAMFIEKTRSKAGSQG
jgi:cellulose synthase/poly-beta-1,6-N-acetylglucosamine synthase-like glycosyltransferase